MRKIREKANKKKVSTKSTKITSRKKKKQK